MTNHKHNPDLGSEISREFLQLLLKRNFAWKPVVALENVGCFLRVLYWLLTLTSEFGKQNTPNNDWTPFPSGRHKLIMPNITHKKNIIDHINSLTWV